MPPAAGAVAFADTAARRTRLRSRPARASAISMRSSSFRHLQFLRAARCFDRVLERDYFTLAQSLEDHHVGIVPFADLNVPDDEIFPVLHVNRGLALVGEACTNGNQQCIRLAFNDDLGSCAHTRAQAI